MRERLIKEEPKTVTEQALQAARRAYRRAPGPHTMTRIADLTLQLWKEREEWEAA